MRSPGSYSWCDPLNTYLRGDPFRQVESRVLCVDTTPSLLRSGLCEHAARIGTQLLWICQLAQVLDPETCTTGHTYRH